MPTKNFIKLNDILVTTAILFFSIFINRSITFNSHSLGKIVDGWGLLEFDIFKEFLNKLINEIEQIKSIF